MGFSWAEISETTDDEIIREHDAMMASRLNVGVDYFLAEIYHRRQAHTARSILRLTIVITVLTLANVAVAIALWMQKW